MFDRETQPLTPSEQIVRDNLLEHVIGRLPAREAFVVRSWLLSDRRPGWIACQLRVSRPRVYQIRQKAIKLMAEICKDLPKIAE